MELPQVPQDIHKIVFVVNIYDGTAKGQHFGLIQNAYIRLINTKNNEELCKYMLTEHYDGMTGLVVGELYRYGAEWKFNAIGQPVQNADRLQSLLNLYS